MMNTKQNLPIHVSWHLLDLFPWQAGKMLLAQKVGGLNPTILFKFEGDGQRPLLVLGNCDCAAHVSSKGLLPTEKGGGASAPNYLSTGQGYPTGLYPTGNQVTVESKASPDTFSSHQTGSADSPVS